MKNFINKRTPSTDPDFIVICCCCCCCLFLKTHSFSAKPYPGRPFDIRADAIDSNSFMVHWTMLPIEIAEHIIGWRLMVTNAQDSKVVISDTVEPSSLSCVVGNLTEGTTYHVQLLGLWDNGTLAREVRSRTLKVETVRDSGERWT